MFFFQRKTEKLRLGTVSFRPLAIKKMADKEKKESKKRKEQPKEETPDELKDAEDDLLMRTEESINEDKTKERQKRQKIAAEFEVKFFKSLEQMAQEYQIEEDKLKQELLNRLSGALTVTSDKKIEAAPSMQLHIIPLFSSRISAGGNANDKVQEFFEPYGKRIFQQLGIDQSKVALSRICQEPFIDIPGLKSIYAFELDYRRVWNVLDEQARRGSLVTDLPYKPNKDLLFSKLMWQLLDSIEANKNNPSPLIIFSNDESTTKAITNQLNRPRRLAEVCAKAAGPYRTIIIIRVDIGVLTTDEIKQLGFEPVSVYYLVTKTANYVSELHPICNLHFETLCRDIAVTHTGINTYLLSQGGKNAAMLKQWKVSYDARQYHASLEKVWKFMYPYKKQGELDKADALLASDHKHVRLEFTYTMHDGATFEAGPAYLKEDGSKFIRAVFQVMSKHIQRYAKLPLQVFQRNLETILHPVDNKEPKPFAGEGDDFVYDLFRHLESTTLLKDLPDDFEKYTHFNEGGVMPLIVFRFGKRVESGVQQRLDAFNSGSLITDDLLANAAGNAFIIDFVPHFSIFDDVAFSDAFMGTTREKEETAMTPFVEKFNQIVVHNNKMVAVRGLRFHTFAVKLTTDTRNVPWENRPDVLAALKQVANHVINIFFRKSLFLKKSKTVNQMASVLDSKIFEYVGACAHPNCSKPTRNTAKMTCTCCYAVNYCDEECQRKNWKEHKKSVKV